MTKKKQKKKWRDSFDKYERDLENQKESEDKKANSGDREETLQAAKEKTQEPCGAAANEKAEGKRKGRYEKKLMEAKMPRYPGRREDVPGDSEGATKKKTPLKTVTSGTQKGDRHTSDARGNINKSGQVEKGRERALSLERDRSHTAPPNGRGKPSAVV